MSAEADAIVFVYLLNEGTDVWRPVHSRHITGDIYELISAATALSDEDWQFPPGSRVHCERRTLSDGSSLVAVSQVID